METKETFFIECVERGCPQPDLDALQQRALRRAYESRGLFPVLGWIAGLALPTEQEVAIAAPNSLYLDTQRNIECGLGKLRRAVVERGAGLPPLLERLADTVYALFNVKELEAMRECLDTHLPLLRDAETGRHELNALACTLVLAYAHSIFEWRFWSPEPGAWQRQLDTWGL